MAKADADGHAGFEGLRVRMVGDHPWNSHAGEIIEDPGGDWITVRLDNGQQVRAYAGQWKKATRVG